nr:hypothetical protein CFP56_22290 [Quercus suber]
MFQSPTRMLRSSRDSILCNEEHLRRAQYMRPKHPEMLGYRTLRALLHRRYSFFSRPLTSSTIASFEQAHVWTLPPLFTCAAVRLFTVPLLERRRITIEGRLEDNRSDVQTNPTNPTIATPVNEFLMRIVERSQLACDSRYVLEDGQDFGNVLGASQKP